MEPDTLPNERLLPIDGEREAVRLIEEGLLTPTLELQLLSIINTPRVIQFGASVTEPKPPNDLDLFLIYDSFSWGAWMDVDIPNSNHANDLSLTIMRGDDESNNFQPSHFSAPGLDVSILSLAQFEHLMSCTPETNKRFSFQRSAILFGSVENILFSHHSQLHPASEIPGSVWEQTYHLTKISSGLPLLIVMAQGDSPSDYIIHTHTNSADNRQETPGYQTLWETEEFISSNDAATEAAFRLDELKTALSALYPELAHKLQTIEDFHTLEGKELVKEITTAFLDALTETTTGTELEQFGQKTAKGIRQNIMTYHLGLNFIQAAIKSGAVQIFGEPSPFLQECEIRQDENFLNPTSALVDGQNRRINEDTTALTSAIMRGNLENLAAYRLRMGDRFLPTIVTTMESTEGWEQAASWIILKNELTHENADLFLRILQIPGLNQHILTEVLEVISHHLEESGSIIFQQAIIENVNPNYLNHVIANLFTLKSGESSNQETYMRKLDILNHLLYFSCRIGNSNYPDFDTSMLDSSSPINPHFVNIYLSLYRNSQHPATIEAQSTLWLIDHIESGGTMFLKDSNSFHTMEQRTIATPSHSYSTRRFRGELESSYADIDDNTLFEGSALRATIINANDLLEITDQPTRNRVQEIVGPEVILENISRHIANIDFTPNNTAHFEWSNLTDSLYYGATDFTGLMETPDVRNGQIQYLYGSTNPRMAAFATRIGFQPVAIQYTDTSEWNSVVIPIQPQLFDRIAQLRISMEQNYYSVSDEQVKSIGVTGLETVAQLSGLTVSVMATIPTIREHVGQIISSRFYQRLAHRKLGIPLPQLEKPEKTPALSDLQTAAI